MFIDAVATLFIINKITFTLVNTRPKNKFIFVEQGHLFCWFELFYFVSMHGLNI